MMIDVCQKCRTVLIHLFKSQTMKNTTNRKKLLFLSEKKNITPCCKYF